MFADRNTSRVFQKFPKTVHYHFQSGLRILCGKIVVVPKIATAPLNHEEMVRRRMRRLALLLWKSGLNSKRLQLPNMAPEEIHTFGVPKNLDASRPCLVRKRQINFNDFDQLKYGARDCWVLNLHKAQVGERQN